MGFFFAAAKRLPFPMVIPGVLSICQTYWSETARSLQLPHAVFTDRSIFSLNLSRIQIRRGASEANDCNHKPGLMSTCSREAAWLSEEKKETARGLVRDQKEYPRKMERHNFRSTTAHNCHGKRINLMAKRNRLTAKRIISRQKEKDSRQKEKPHGKKISLMAKRKTQNFFDAERTFQFFWLEV